MAHLTFLNFIEVSARLGVMVQRSVSLPFAPTVPVRILRATKTLYVTKQNIKKRPGLDLLKNLVRNIYDEVKIVLLALKYLCSIRLTVLVN